MTHPLPFAKIHRCITGSFVDLEVVDAPAPYALAVHGYQGAYTSYFHILVEGSNFIDLDEGASCNHVDLFLGIEQTFALTDKWRHAQDIAPGQALFLWHGDLWRDVQPHDLHLICADRFDFRAGPQWAFSCWAQAWAPS